MASSSEDVHVEEVVVVTTPDGSGQTSSVEEMKDILESTGLQPEVDIMDQNLESESGSSVILPKEAVLVKLSEEVDVETDILYQITCGDSKADLVWKKFVCPGINVKCVQFNSHLISPKEFVYLAGKSTLKDWKRAIRLNGTMLRKIMDSGELDFYQHGKLCSNTCRSTKIDLMGSRASLSSQPSTETVPPTPSSADVNGSATVFSTETSEDSTEWVTAIGEDTMTFWRGLKDAGLLEDIMEDLQREMDQILKGLQERIQEPPLQVNDAALLNNIVQNFGMLDLVKKVLASHKSEMDRCREQYTRSLVALEQQCDEHRKRAKELKSKSQHLNNVLMTLTPTPSPPSLAKRPRLTRAASGPAHFALPVAQLATALPLDKILAPAHAPAQTPFLGGYTVLTSPGGGAELQPDATNLTVLSSAAVQEGGGPATTIVKVVSPFQLVTLPPSLQNINAPAGGATLVAVPVSAASVENSATQVAVAENADGNKELNAKDKQ